VAKPAIPTAIKTAKRTSTFGLRPGRRGGFRYGTVM
jgi:hypothetical protein